MYRVFLHRVVCTLAVLLLPELLFSDEAATPMFERDVRPILKAHCWHCHGEETELKGGIDTRLVRLLIQGGDSGPAISAGNHSESLLYQRMVSGEMPPGEKKVSADELSIIAEWIDAGAKTLRPEPDASATVNSFTEEERSHWAFQPIARPEVPTVSQQGLVSTPLDAFWSPSA
jgi:hypothetical protein